MNWILQVFHGIYIQILHCSIRCVALRVVVGEIWYKRFPYPIFYSMALAAKTITITITMTTRMVCFEDYVSYIKHAPSIIGLAKILYRLKDRKLFATISLDCIYYTVDYFYYVCLFFLFLFLFYHSIFFYWEQRLLQIHIMIRPINIYWLWPSVGPIGNAVVRFTPAGIRIIVTFGTTQKEEIDQNTTTTTTTTNILDRGTIKRKFGFLYLSETKWTTKMKNATYPFPLPPPFPLPEPLPV